MLACLCGGIEIGIIAGIIATIASIIRKLSK
jgi:hypothetical protein